MKERERGVSWHCGSVAWWSSLSEGLARQAAMAHHERQTSGLTARCSLTGRPTNGYNFTFLSRSAFDITDTELNVIAAAAIIGFNRMPNAGYSTPAASGIPSAL